MFYEKELEQELENLIECLPHSTTLHEYFFNIKENTDEYNNLTDLQKCIRFIYLKSFSLYGGEVKTCKMHSFNNTKENLTLQYQKFKQNYLTQEYKEKIHFENLDFRKMIANFLKSDYIQNTKFQNSNFKDVLKITAFREQIEKDRTFIYADPPYLNTDGSYNKTCKWSYNDTQDLFNILVNSGIRFAISEFNNPEVIKLAQENDLNVIFIQERRSIMSKEHKTEILITNYKQQDLFS